MPRSAAEGGAFVKGNIDAINGEQITVSVSLLAHFVFVSLAQHSLARQGKPHDAELVMPAEPEENSPCDDNCKLYPDPRRVGCSSC